MLLIEKESLTLLLFYSKSKLERDVSNQFWKKKINKYYYQIYIVKYSQKFTLHKFSSKTESDIQQYIFGI